MTLANSLQQSLSNWRPSDRESLDVTANGWALALVADHNDVVGSLLWELTFTRTAATSDVTLASWAQSIAARSSGLLERLKVLEIDTARNEAILRSDAPTPKGDLVAYYELKLFGTDAATLQRYNANRSAGSSRSQQVFAVTQDALLKLVHDVTA
jgi:hypothetical protein